MQQQQHDETSRAVAWVGRYALFDELARGGMATVHLARLTGPAGFSKTVAIKKMLGNFAHSPRFLRMFLDEARLAGRIQHPNVVSVFDVISEGDAVYLVMEYVDGEPLWGLCDSLHQRGQRVSVEIAAHVLRDALYGLHAAHEATNEKGESLELVHRDVSPQNILVGVDGVARVLDFGIAKAAGRLQDTDAGQLKGKVAYMAPEQLLGQAIDRRADVFAAGVVLWEVLAGERLFAAPSPSESMYRVLEEAVPSLAGTVPELPPGLVAAVARATAKNPAERFATALDFARAIEDSVELIPNHVVGQWVLEVSGEKLRARRERVRAIEAVSIPAEPRLPGMAAVGYEAKPVTFERASPDDETKADAPIAVASEIRKPPRSSSVIALLAVALALVAASALWLVLHREPAGEPVSAASAPAVASAPLPPPIEPAPTAASAATSSVPVPSVSVTANKPRPASALSRSAKPTKPPSRPLPSPESLFSRE